jgi:hypothetical protein
MSWGDDDPSIPQAAQVAHALAVAQGSGHYRDPLSGMTVLTTLFLSQRGRCCGSGCRHCPYDRDAQRCAGRIQLRPETRLPR